MTTKEPKTNKEKKPFKDKQTSRAKRKKVNVQHDSETDEDQDLHLDDEESDFETLSEIGAEAIAETLEFERHEVNDKQVGDWLLVKINSERKISQYFIGTIESIDLETENPIVIFLRRIKSKSAPSKSNLHMA